MTQDAASPNTDPSAAKKVPHEAASQPVLKAEKLAKRVISGERTLTILHDLSLSVAAGESVAILGKSGAGKSTLLGLLAGLDTPSDGELTLFGHALSRLDEDGRAALRAGKAVVLRHLVPPFGPFAPGAR